MITKVKELLSNWKVTVTLIGGAIVIATVFGTCTVEPGLQSPPADEAEDVPGVEAVLEVTVIDANNSIETTTTNNNVEETEAEASTEAE